MGEAAWLCAAQLVVSSSQLTAFLNCSEFKPSLLQLLLALWTFVSSSKELWLGEGSGAWATA